MHISTNDLHFCKPARLLQQAPSGGRPRRRPPATAPPRIAPPHQHRYVGVVECATGSLPPASSSLTHARRMDGFCNQNADKIGFLAGLSLLTVYTGVVECAPASPYTYSSSTHRFPDEHTPIEDTSLSATSAELGLGLGQGLGLDSLSHSLLLARATFLLATLLSHTSLFPRVH
jgi:hypothetical protein